MLRLKGVPLGLLNSNFVFDLSSLFHPITIEGEEKSVTVSRAMQSASFKSFLSDPTEDAKVYVFTSRHNYIKARALALLAFGVYGEKRGRHQWIVANGQFKPFEVKKGLLALDSISDEMAPYKRDKMHDLCQEYCGRPMFILHHGVSPYETCIDSLGVRPSMIFNLDSSIKMSGEKKVRKL